MLVALTARLKGVEAAAPVVGIASVVVGIGGVLFAWLELTRVGAPRSAAGSAKLRTS
ncbi:MAG: hypothetical protein JSS56_23090 [Proteobacteria bacterium]|nr:hypothetical protein [Pseudomonadota bacterium]